MVRRWIWLCASGLLFAVGCDEPAPAPEVPTVESGQSPTEPTPAEPALVGATVNLSIEGMVCESCANAARACLEGVEGVEYVDVSFQERAATIGFDPERVGPETLVAALAGVDRGEAPAFEARVLGRDLSHEPAVAP